ncbi:pyridoxal-dependent decarboxylase [Achlya hypogyna]|uniref:Pyridoxal-dependent decarboxylase n=1 Tax=Achlya hypogyna TaxID=1202772 RepID=A0A1V9Z8U6_ACHHY|nr:pyridoxal-dependent decarboxylase [Achlya hypogyna]
MASTKLHRRVLRKTVEQYRPELLPLFVLYHKTETHHQWEMESMADAVKLSTFLHSKMLLSPELNRNSPCYIARRIIQLYIKLKYIATFPPHEIDEYSAIGDQEYDEVRMVHHLLNNATTDTETVYRLASMLGISYHGDAWTEIMNFVRSALPFAEQTETLLVRGSDDRSILDTATHTNKYNTSTIPCAVPQHAWISRASCTSSSVSLDGYTLCEHIRQELLLSSLSINHENIREVFDRKMQSVRRRIADCLGLRTLYDDGAFECIVSPSGTDAELLATSVALARLATVAGVSTGRVTVIVTAGGETGSGSVAASNGKHFSKLAPSGDTVEPGKPLRAFPSAKVQCVQIAARQDDGAVQNADATVRASVVEALSTSPQAAHNVVLLHVVMGSKTGLSCPSLELVDELSAQYTNRLVVVIDACQMRLDKLSLVEYVARGYLILVTGSKFFAGVPFCGGVLIPSLYIDELESKPDLGSVFPAGYSDYFSKYEFPPLGMPNTRARFPPRMNVGLLLRWETALLNMELYASIPSAMVGQICYEYIARSKQMLRTHAHIALLEDADVGAAKPSVAGDGTLLQPLDTIISFHVVDAGTYLSVERLKLVHMFLSKDISSVITETCPLEVALASKKCLVGQPVTLGKLPHGVLRIALGADMVNCIYRGIKTMVELVLEDAIVVRKLQLILSHWEPLCARFVDVPVQHHLPSTPPKPAAANSVWNFAVKTAAKSPALRALLASGHDLFPRMVLYDLDAVDVAFQTLVAPFPPHFEHRFSVSACPLAFFLRRAIENDVGLTCASIVEVQHALRLGCAPHKIVFTSPVKTRREIAYAIDMGVEVNADSFEELEIIKAHAQQRFQSNFPECTPRYAGELPRIGVRVHVCHEADHAWMAGIPLTKDNRAKLVLLFKEHPWLAGLVLATCPGRKGSAGLLHEVADGATQLCDLANEIDAVAGETRIKVLNVGGGLNANYECDDVGTTFATVVEVLHAEAPKIFERNGRTVLTEHGDYISAKVGWTVSEVEYVRHHTSGDGTQPIQTAVIDAGVDVHQRLPDGKYKHRVSVFKANGQLSTAPEMLQSAVCLGEPLQHEWSSRVMTVPLLERGDYVALHDTGATMATMGHGSNGQPAPPVYGYRRHDDALHVVLLKAAESPEQVMQLWG